MLLCSSWRTAHRGLPRWGSNLLRVRSCCRGQVNTIILPKHDLNLHSRVIDVGSEWRTFSNEKAGADPSRVGGPENPLLSGSDLTTLIGPGRGDASYDGFGVSKYQNRRSMSSSDRALINAFREINAMADRINLPKTIVDRANNLFKQVHDGKNLKGRANDAIASAALYIACRQEGVPRTFKVCFYLNLV